MPMPTLLDIAKLNGTDAVVGLIEEASRACPEVRLGGARPIKGISYRTRVRTGLPTVGFRGANEGTAVSKSTFENRLVECFIFNPPWECDKAVADCFEEGPEAFIAIEGAGLLSAALISLAKCFYYGQDATFGDAKGFPGLLAMHDAANMVVDAAGTTDNTASSVWAVRFGVQHVSWVYGNGGQLDLSDVTEVRLADAAGNPYMAYHQEILARPGLQVGSLYSVGRIKKLTEDAGKGMTDKLAFDLLAKFPTGVTPDMFLMSRRSLFQLRASRTATNATGAPAPIPTEIAGIPIQVTDAISNKETLAL
jgi:hypothetical protein